MLSRLGNDMIRLIAKLRREFTMPFQHLFPRKQVFAISCAMRCNLCSSRTLSANLLQMFLDLCPS